jgi:iron(III) transport system permease protein
MRRTQPIHNQTELQTTHQNIGWMKPLIPGSGSILRLVAVAIVALTLLPLGYLVLRAAGADSGIHFLVSQRTLKIVGNSLKLTGAVTLSASLIGVLVAWLTTRTDLPLRRLWLITSLLPLVIPSFIGALAYVAALGPQGMLQHALASLGITSIPSIYGFNGAWISITLFTYPYVVLPVRAALLSMDPSLEESARSLGSDRWSVFRRVTIPQLRPALATGMLLTALYTLSDFGAVTVMRYNAFTRAIFLQYTSSFDRNRAAMLSLVLVILALGLLVAQRRIASSKRNYRAGGPSTARQLRPVGLGRWRFPSIIFCALLILAGLITPTVILITWLLQSMRAGLGPFSGAFIGSTLNTLTVSGLAALSVGLLAIPLSLLSARTDSRLNRWLVNLSYLGNSLPGVVVALAMVFFAANYLPALYQTLPLLIFGYSVRFLPLSVGATRSALTQINPRYEEAGRSLGVPAWKVNLRITMPLVRSGILGGMALVFLSVMKELPTTLLLAPTGFKTLAIQIWSAQNEAYHTLIGAPALLLISASALSLLLIVDHDNQKGLL